MQHRALPLLTVFELGFGVGSIIGDLENSLTWGRIQRPWPFFIIDPPGEIARACAMLTDQGLLSDELNLAGQYADVFEAWNEQWLQLRQNLSEGVQPNNEDHARLENTLREVAALNASLEREVGSFPGDLPAWFSLGMAVGRGKFMEEGDFSGWSQDVLGCLRETDPQELWSEEALGRIHDGSKVTEVDVLRELVSYVHDEIRSGIGMVKADSGDFSPETTQELATSFQETGERLTQIVGDLVAATEELEGPAVVVLPRIADLPGRLDTQNHYLSIGGTHVDFRGSTERFNIVERLIKAQKPLPQHELTYAPGVGESLAAQDMLPNEDADLAVWINRIRDDLENAALEELRRIALEQAEIDSLPPETETALAEEARLLRSAIPKAQRPLCGVTRLYRWDFGVLLVGVSDSDEAANG